VNEYIKLLKKYRKRLTRQQLLTLRGQILSGDIDGFKKGLQKILNKKYGTILDPFNGSGSTGKAVMYENYERNKNYKYIGIELTEEYLPISKARIECLVDSTEKNQEEPKENITEGQTNIFDFIKEGE